MRRLNKEELCVGALMGLAWGLATGWLIVGLIPLAAWLWAMGGAGHKWMRRIVFPLFLCALIHLAVKDIVIIWSIVPLWAVLSIGYGVPSINDEGSWLGKRLFNLVDGVIGEYESERAASFLCRGIIGLLISVAMLPLMYVSLPAWVCGSVICTLGYPMVVYWVE